MRISQMKSEGICYGFKDGNRYKALPSYGETIENMKVHSELTI